MVRIVADYWKNYEQYKRVIKRCFYSLYIKFHIDDNVDAVFNQVLVALHNRDIFTRFDMYRADTSKVSIDVKFEQYIYMSVLQALSNIYKSQGNHTRKFIPYGSMQDYHPDTYHTSHHDQSFESEENFRKTPAPADPKKDSKQKSFPWYGQTYGFYVSEEEDAEGSVYYKEMIELIRSKLPENKRIIFDLMLKDYEPQDVAALMDCSQEIVYRTIREYRQKAGKLIKK